MIIKKPSGEKMMILNLSIRKVCPMNHIIKIYSLTTTTLRTVFVSKVNPITMLKMSWMTMMKMSGGTLMIMNLSIVKVGSGKLVIGIRNTFKMILITLFLLKVSWMTMMKMNGGTVMILNQVIVMVRLVKRIM